MNRLMNYLSVVEADPEKVIIPRPNFSWISTDSNLLELVGVILWVALALCGIRLIIAAVQLAAVKLNWLGADREPFLGGLGSAVKAAVVVGSLVAAMEYGIRKGSDWTFTI